MDNVAFNFTSTVSGKFDDVDFFAGTKEITLIDGKYAFNGNIPKGGILNIAIDVYGDNGQQIDVAYTCKDSAGNKHEDAGKLSVVNDRIVSGRGRRITLRLPF